MRRYRHRGELRKLKPAISASHAAEPHQRRDKKSAETSALLTDKETSPTKTAVKTSADRSDGRILRYAFGLLAVLVAGYGITYVALERQVAQTATEISQRAVNDEFDRRGNQILGFFAVQQNLLRLERDFDHQLRAYELYEGSDKSEEERRAYQVLLIDQTTDELSAFLFDLSSDGNDSFNDLPGYTMSSGDRTFMETQVADALAMVSSGARSVSHYQPIIDLYMSGPSVGRQSDSFLVDFSYASGLVLLSDPFLQRDIADGFERADLYKESRAARRLLTGWPELTYLYELLLEAQLGGSVDELTTIAAPMGRLNRTDMDSMIRTIAEIGYDSSVDAAYGLAGERTVATISRGCSLPDAFIPRPVCNRIAASGALGYFRSSEPETAGFRSVSLDQAVGAAGVPALMGDGNNWSAGHEGRVHHLPADKRVMDKDAYLSGTRR
ncbi:MAG: hypothetical protein AAF511_03305 [Pseudomonadota bacterium]